MEEFEESYMLLDVVVDGKERKGRAYYTENPETKAHYDECSGRAKGLVPIAALTDDQLRETYSRLSSIVDCVRATGVDVGVMISEDEFVTNGGAYNGLTSKWSELEQQEQFNAQFFECGQAFPPVG